MKSPKTSNSKPSDYMTMYMYMYMYMYIHCTCKNGMYIHHVYCLEICSNKVSPYFHCSSFHVYICLGQQYQTYCPPCSDLSSYVYVYTCTCIKLHSLYIYNAVTVVDNDRKGHSEYVKQSESDTVTSARRSQPKVM